MYTAGRTPRWKRQAAWIPFLRNKSFQVRRAASSLPISRSQIDVLLSTRMSICASRKTTTNTPASPTSPVPQRRVVAGLLHAPTVWKSSSVASPRACAHAYARTRTRTHPQPHTPRSAPLAPPQPPLWLTVRATTLGNAAGACSGVSGTHGVDTLEEDADAMGGEFGNPYNGHGRTKEIVHVVDHDLDTISSNPHSLPCVCASTAHV